MLEIGLNVGVGTDGAAHDNDLDMFDAIGRYCWQKSNNLIRPICLRVRLCSWRRLVGQKRSIWGI